MNIAEDEYSEFYNDMRRESYYDARKEAEMRRDYDAFMDYLEAEIEVFADAFKDIERKHNMYGWSMSRDDLLTMLKEYV